MSSERTLAMLVVVVTLNTGLLLTILYRQHQMQALPAGDNASISQLSTLTNSTALSIEGLPTNGSPKAKVVIVEFSDYECPYCAKYEADTFPQLSREFIDTGKVRYVLSGLPLQIHPSARLLAAAALCAGIQDQRWPMHHLLYARKPRTDHEAISVARTLSLDLESFKACLTSQAAKAQIEKELGNARMLNLTSTPAFAIGEIDGTNRVRIDTLIVGAKPTTVFQSAIRASLTRLGE